MILDVTRLSRVISLPQVTAVLVKPAELEGKTNQNLKPVESCMFFPVVGVYTQMRACVCFSCLALKKQNIVRY